MVPRIAESPISVGTHTYVKSDNGISTLIFCVCSWKLSLYCWRRREGVFATRRITVFLVQIWPDTIRMGHHYILNLYKAPAISCIVSLCGYIYGHRFTSWIQSINRFWGASQLACYNALSPAIRMVLWCELHCGQYVIWDLTFLWTTSEWSSSAMYCFKDICLTVCREYSPGLPSTFFAYFEKILSLPAAFIDPQIVNLQSFNYDSWSVIIYQRSSVILTELVLGAVLVK